MVTALAAARVVIRLIGPEDIDERMALYADPDVQTNLGHLGALLPREQARRVHEDWIGAEDPERLIYRVATPSDKLVGFTWLDHIDWVNETCELSIAVVPAFRQRYGLLVLIQMYEYLYSTLNMRAVVNQILSVNEMLLGAHQRDGRAQVICPDDSYTAGEIRTAYLWSQTSEENDAYTTRKLERGARIRRRIESGGAGSAAGGGPPDAR
jgi:hypothetical protein